MSDSNTYKYRYTATIEIAYDAKQYPERGDQLEIERGNAEALLAYALSEGAAKIDVIRVR